MYLDCKNVAIKFKYMPHPQNHAYYAGIMLDAFAHPIMLKIMLV